MPVGSQPPHLLLPVRRRSRCSLAVIVEEPARDHTGGSREYVLASAAPSDDPAALWRAAALLGLGPDAAEPAVVQGIVSLDPRVAFRHPLIRSAVYEGATVPAGVSGRRALGGRR